VTANDPDRPLLIKSVIGTMLFFFVLACAAGGFLVARDRIALGGFVGVVVAGAVLGALAGWVVVLVSGVAAGGVVQMLTGAGNLAPATSFSYEEALVMQGKPDEAVDSFRDHLRQHPMDQEARLALAALLAGAANNLAEAEQEFLAVRSGQMTDTQEFRASQALIDLYSATGQRGKYMAELARFAERFRGTPAGEGAKRALGELKKDVTA
jgi:hypothetical protein